MEHGAVSRRGHNDRPMPSPHRYRGRRAAVLEDDDVRVTVLEEGGHIAEIFDRRSAVNPLWTPPWRSIEPSAFTPAHRAEYGTDVDAQLLAGLMGHNLCVDLFGGPSPECSPKPMLTKYAGASANVDLRTTFTGGLLPSPLRVEREIEILGRALRIRERIDNLSGCDRPIGWTQHVTLGHPSSRKGSPSSAPRRAVESVQRAFGARLPRPGRGVRLAAGAQLAVVSPTCGSSRAPPGPTPTLPT